MPAVRYVGTASRYRLTNGDVDVTTDDPVVEVDEDTATYLLEETDQFESADDAALLNPSDYTVDELEAELEGLELSDADREALLDAERDGDARETAIDAIAEA